MDGDATSSRVEPRRRRGTERAAVGALAAMASAVALAALSFLLWDGTVARALLSLAGVGLIACGAILAGNGRVLHWVEWEQPQTGWGCFVQPWLRLGPHPRRPRFITIGVGIGAVFIGCGWILIAAFGS